MALLIQNRYLNLIPGLSAPIVVHCSFGDYGQELKFDMLNGEEPYSIPVGTNISMHGIRSDGAGVGPFACTYSDTQVTATIDQTMTCVAGPVLCELTLTDSNGTIGTANFLLLVENAVFPNGVTYSNDPSVYQALLDYIMTVQRIDDIYINTKAELEALVTTLPLARTYCFNSSNLLSALTGGTVTGTWKGYVTPNSTASIDLSGTVGDGGRFITGRYAISTQTFTYQEYALQSAVDTLNTSSYLLKSGKGIAPNADLNTDTYCEYGTYHASNSETAISLANCPVRTVFRMIVTAMSSGESANYHYVKRTIISGTGDSDYKEYTQICNKNGANSSWEYGSWKLVPSRAEVDTLNTSLTTLNDKLFATLTNDTDFDDIVSSGEYIVYTSTNAPDGARVYGVSVYSNSAHTSVVQVVTAVNSSNAYLYKRAYNGSAWSSWYRFTGTAI